MEGLNRTFANLRKQGPATGDPTCPSLVARGKRVFIEIGQLSGMVSDAAEDLDLPVVFADGNNVLPSPRAQFAHRTNLPTRIIGR